MDDLGGFDRFEMEQPAYSVVQGGSKVAIVHGIREDGSIEVVRAERWHTTDPAVATVDEGGCVHGVAPGTTAVTAMVDDHHGVYAEAELTVVAGFRGHVGFRTEHPEYAVAIGGTIWVNLLGVAPDGSVEQFVAERWSSSDPAVATIDATGTVTGIASGNVQVVAGADGGVEFAAAQVSVVDGQRGYTHFRAEADELTVAVGATVQAKVIGSRPDDVGDPLDRLPGEPAPSVDEVVTPTAWSSTDPAIATVDPDGLVTGVAEGVTTLYAQLDGPNSEPLALTVQVTP